MSEDETQQTFNRRLLIFIVGLVSILLLFIGVLLFQLIQALRSSSDPKGYCWRNAKCNKSMAK